ncbi:GUN4 domain-containing protein [Kamptonema formosum]|uniref:GUN4 domain-containing protein n=1 Tax=Kamptonema formosum TaxID=331992 RepID=UPI00350F313C
MSPVPKPVSPPPSPSGSLASDRGIDYSHLHKLLKANKWKEADIETRRLVLKAGYPWQSFPCTDLQTLDQLWVKYSNGRFWFSVQKRIAMKRIWRESESAIKGLFYGKDL